MIKQLIRGITGILLLATGTICILSTKVGNILDVTFSLIGGAMIILSIFIMIQFTINAKAERVDKK